MLDQITYNRSEKRYEFIDPESGEILTAPTKQKHELFKTAVALLDPDLFAAAAQWLDHTPQLERTIWRAVELVATNSIEVYDVAQNGLVAMVDGSDEYGRYAIEHNEEGQTTCQCIAFHEHPQYDQNGRVWCKHTAAVKLYQVARSEF
jgi:uncharacterized Zn finger protein